MKLFSDVLFIFLTLFHFGVLADETICDTEFAKNYYLKKNCVVNADEASCIALGLKSLGKTNEKKSISTAVATILTGSKGPLSSGISEYALNAAKWQIEASEAFKRGKQLYAETMEEVRAREMKFWHGKTFGTTQEWINSGRYSDARRQSVKVETIKALEAMKIADTPALKAAQALAVGTDFHKTYILFKIAQTYPEEAHALRTYLANRQRLLDNLDKVKGASPPDFYESPKNLREMSREERASARGAAQRANETKLADWTKGKDVLTQSAERALSEFDLRFRKTMAAGPEKFRRVFELFENATGKDSPVVKAVIARLRAMRPQLGMAVHEIIDGETGKIMSQTRLGNIARKKGNFKVNPSSAGGFIVGTALTVAAEQALSFGGNVYLSELLGQCGKTLGLSYADSQYLGQFHFFSDTKIKYTGGELLNRNCDQVYLNLPENEVLDLLRKQKEIPKGICNLIKKEDAYLEGLFSESMANPPDCKANPLIKTENNMIGAFKPTIFSYRGLSVPYEESHNWPMFSLAPSGSDAHSTVNKMPCDYFGGADENGCISKQIYACKDLKSESCQHIKVAVQNRIFMSMKETLCEETIPAAQNDPNWNNPTAVRSRKTK